MKGRLMFDAMSKIDDEIIDGKKKNVSLKIYKIAAAAAVVMIASAAAVMPIALSRAKRVDPQPDPVTPSFGRSTVVGSVPDWYAPGELKIISLSVQRSESKTVQNTRKTRFSPYLSAAAGIKSVSYKGFGEAVTEEEIPADPDTRFTLGDAPGEYRITGEIGAHYIRVNSADRNNEHFYCAGQFYDMQTGEVICLNHRIAEMCGVKIKIESDGFPTHFIDDRGNFDGLCFVELHYNNAGYTEKEKENGAWISDLRCALYNFEDDTLTPLPDGMYYAVINGYYKVFDGGKTVVYVDGRYGLGWNENVRRGLKLAVLSDGAYTVTDLPSESGYNALSSGSAHMTADGRYLVYAAPVSGIDYKHMQVYTDARIRVYDRETNGYNDFTGRFITLTEDSKYIVYESDSGRMIYDIADNVSYKAGSGGYDNALENTCARYEITREKAGEIGTYNVIITDNITGEIADIVGHVNAYTVAGEYLYWFDSEKMAVVCRRLVPGGGSFEIALSDDFAEAFNGIGEDQWNYSRIKVSADGKQLVVYYQTWERSMYIWIPEAVAVPEELKDLPAQFWRCENVNEAMMEMITLRDDRASWRAELSVGDNDKKTVDFSEAAAAVDMFDPAHNGEITDNSAVSGHKEEFTVYYECTLDSGREIRTEASGYIIDGEYYVCFNGYKTVKIKNREFAADTFDWIMRQYEVDFNA